MRVEIVEYALVDIAGELDLARVGTLLEESPEAAPLVALSATPSYAAFPPPLEVRPDPKRLGDAPPGSAVEVRVHAIGAVAVRLRVPVEVAHVHDLLQAAAAVRVGGRQMREAAFHLAAAVRRDLEPARVEAYSVELDPERYRVFCLIGGGPSPEELLTTHRDDLAAVVEGESRRHVLSAGTVEDATRHALGYGRDDLVLVGWDHAVVVGAPGTYEDVLDVVEIANLELLELRVYDTYLDARLESSFAALDRLWARGGLFRSARVTLSELSALSVDFARLTEGLRDTGKPYGDWYLARLHKRLRDRFHLEDWERAVRGKMDTLGTMFRLAGEETNHRRAIVLEALIVLLFVVDLVLLVALAK